MTDRTKQQRYVVACKDEDIYVLATSRQFRSFSDAELYTRSIAVARHPIIVLLESTHGA